MTVQISACARCGVSFGLPDELYMAAKASSKINFYCPYGHEQHFSTGPTEAEKLRLERDRLQQQIAYKDDTIKAERARREQTERQLLAQRGVVTRIKNRVAYGVCPCCTRSFQNLQRHMASKHAAWTPEKETAP